MRKAYLNNYKNMPPEQFKEHMINDLFAHGVLNAEEVASRIINSAKKLNDSGRKRIFRKLTK
jgi:SOS response regulatory protein OraA/RecX